LGTGGDLTGAGSGKMIMETSDGFGIVGATEFGNRLMAFGKSKAFIVDDTDASIANWGYEEAQWEGGVAHNKLLVKTPNDLVAMMEDGEIYSVSAVQSYGDYKQASLSRPAFVHAWITENCNLALIDQFHAKYFRDQRCIKFFVIRNGQSQIDTALVYFVDRSPAEAWQLHDNLLYPSGYNAASSFEVRESVGVYRVYTGDYVGNVWGLEQSAKNDNANGYQCKFRTPPLAFDNPRVKKKYRRGFVGFNPKGAYVVNVTAWVDNVQLTAQTITTTGAGGVYDTGLFDSALYGGQEADNVPFPIGSVGTRAQFELENSVANQDFFITQLLIDHEVLGGRPQ
jgi:hypothetical protein